MNGQVARYGHGFEVVFGEWVVYHDPKPDARPVANLIACLPVAELQRLARGRSRLHAAWHAQVWRDGRLTSHDEADRQRYSRLREKLNERAIAILQARYS
jgi:hypothetical protein